MKIMDDPQRILVVQLKRLGDVILATPIPELLKRRWPQARIDFLVEKAFAPILENNPWIDQVQIYDRNRVWRTLQRVRFQRYDWIVDFQSSPRSSIIVQAGRAALTAGYRVPFWGRFYKHTVARPNGTQTVVQGKISLIQPLVGGVSEAPEPRIFLTPEEKAWAEGCASFSNIIGIVPTHRRASRRWASASFAAVARLFDQEGYGVWLFWGPGEESDIEQIQKLAPNARLIPPTSVRQMAALLQRCRLVVSNDNGPMHMAVAVGVPTVTLYGPTDPRCWNPGGPRHAVVQAAGVRCLGCNLNNCPFGHECMTQISPRQAFEACRELLYSLRTSDCGLRNED